MFSPPRRLNREILLPVGVILLNLISLAVDYFTPAAPETVLLPVRATALISTLLLAVGLIVEQLWYEHPGEGTGRLPRVLFILSAYLMLEHLIGEWIGARVGISGWLVNQPSEVFDGTLGPISPLTGSALFLLSIALLFKNKYTALRDTLYGLSAGLAFLALTGYLFGYSRFYQFEPTWYEMPPIAAVAIITLAWAAARRPPSGPLSIFMRNTPVTILGKRLLLVGMVSTLLLGVLIVSFVRSNRLDIVPAMAVFAALNIAVAVIAIYLTMAHSAVLEEDRTRADLRYMESQSLLSNIINNVSTLVYVKDLEGKYLLANRTFSDIFGLSPEDMIDRTDLDLYPEDLAKRYRNNHRTAAETGEPLRTEKTFFVDGEARSFLALIFPLRQEQVGIYATGCVATDITEIKHTQESLQRSNEELEKFAYVASHDLQEPLRMVSSYMQLLESRYKEQLDEDAQEFIDYAVDGAHRMQRLIQDLLQFSRVGTRGNPIETTESRAVLDAALRDLDSRITEAEAKIDIGELPLVEADRSQLSQVFQNLISNSIKFRKPDVPPVIRIRATRSDGFAQFSIADNGIGFEPKHAERIFIIFQRLNSRAEYEGTGIGLAICKKIIDRHGGRIWVDSKPDQGSTFHFTLPLPRDERVRGMDQREPERESVAARARRMV